MEQQKQAFNLTSILNLESYFKREPIIDENYQDVSNIIDLNIGNTIENDQIAVFLTVEIKQRLNNVNLVEIKVVTAGTFKKEGNVTQDLIDMFCKINAPAIIFPFVRESIANLSMKGGLQPIIIQPINFIELNKQEKDLEKK